MNEQNHQKGLYVLRFSSRANFVKSDERFLQFIIGKEYEQVNTNRML